MGEDRGKVWCTCDHSNKTSTVKILTSLCSCGNMKNHEKYNITAILVTRASGNLGS